jgi:nitrogen fixation protein FixH
MLFILMLIGVLGVSACGGGGAATPAASMQISVTTLPDPPVKGPVELIVDVKDAQGQPLNDANVIVLTSHTTMNGMNQQGPAKARGNGRYAMLTDMSGMNGQWLITVQVSKGSLNLAQDFKIDVQ